MVSSARADGREVGAAERRRARTARPSRSLASAVR